MKNLILAALILLSCIQFAFAQPTAFAELGDSLVIAFEKGDVEKFEKLLIPKESFIKMMEDNLPDGLPEDSKEQLFKTIDENYATQMMAAYRKNFSETLDLIKEYKIPLDTLKFEEYDSKSSQNGKDAKVIHAPLHHETYNHLYIIAREIDGRYYILAPLMKISEEEVEM